MVQTDVQSSNEEINSLIVEVYQLDLIHYTSSCRCGH